MKPYHEPTLRVTPGGKPDHRGLIPFRLALWTHGKEVDHLTVCSGQPGAQELVKCAKREAGSGMPIGEGCYRLGDSDSINGINWASGVQDDFTGSWASGLGPIWVGIHAAPGYPCSTTDYGLHADWNQDEGFPGTLGCLGIPTPGHSLTDLRRVRDWFEGFDPKMLIVDYGLGTVPKPGK